MNRPETLRDRIATIIQIGKVDGTPADDIAGSVLAEVEQLTDALEIASSVFGFMDTITWDEGGFCRVHYSGAHNIVNCALRATQQ